jgi:chromosomal replication initiator protein
LPPEDQSAGQQSDALERADRLWSEISQRLRAGMTAHEFETWFRPLGFRLRENQAVLLVPNHFYSEWIRERHQELLARALSETLGRGMGLAFELASGAPEFPPPEPTEPEPLILDAAPEEPVSPLAPRYTFKNFVVGPCNELAHAACQAVSDHPGRQYNPLFIFGAAGLGKTHLLTAVGNHLLKRFPGYKVVYCSTEAFTNELLQAVRFDGINAFRDKYRLVDGLLLDDIQFLAGRERTQEEFFHTFNTLYEAGKQIILTSDKMPRDIPGLEKRLQSRFEWGLITDLQPPDEETKVAILQAKAAEHGVDLSHQVCFYLAQQPESNVRVLEGYLTRIIAVSNFQGVEVTLDLVRRVVGPMLAERQVSLDDVMGTVARHYGVKVTDIKSSRKTREVTHPRQVAMYLARKLTRASFPEIGKAFGNKDHSTVVKGVKKMEHVLQEDPEEAERVRSLERILREGGLIAEPRGINGGD